MTMDFGEFLVLLIIGLAVAIVIVTATAPQDSSESGGRLPTLEDILPGKNESVLPQEAPDRKQIKWREHAVEAHGQDAIDARNKVVGCGFEDLRVKMCAAGKYGLSVYQWCEPAGATICAGTITTIGGIEKTSFSRPCSQWHSCQ
jgi:hypothetical protein